MTDEGRTYLSPAAKDFIAGGVAGALSIALTQPLDTVRVNLQNGSSGVQHQRNGLWREFRHLVQGGGAKALWKGMSFPLTFASLQNAILFQTCGAVLRHQSEEGRLKDVHSGRSIPSVHQAFAAGCAAGLAQVFLWSPVELIKLRLQLQKKASAANIQVVTGGRAAWTHGPAAAGSIAMLRHVIRHEGLRGLYRGFTVTMLRDVPSYGIYFGTYYYGCTRLEHWKKGVHVHPEESSPGTQILVGGLSGTLAWSSIYYLDVVKSRMQMESFQKSQGKTWIDFAKQVYRERGLMGFTKGLQPTLVRAFLMDAVAFYGFSLSLHTLDSMC